LLNNQTEANKPAGGKKKLSLKAGTYNPINTENSATQIKESMSEPNSATIDNSAKNFKKKSNGNNSSNEETKAETNSNATSTMLSIPENMIESTYTNDNKEQSVQMNKHREYTPQDPTFYNKPNYDFDGNLSIYL
jgi:hypothetical protein